VLKDRSCVSFTQSCRGKHCCATQLPRQTHLPKRKGVEVEGLKGRGVQAVHTTTSFVQKGVSHAKGICAVIPATLSTFGFWTDKGPSPFAITLFTWQSPSWEQHIRNLSASVSSRIHSIAKFYSCLRSSSPGILQSVLVSLSLCNFCNKPQCIKDTALGTKTLSSATINDMKSAS